jgi:DNA-binding transcriptional LysR family regulator
MLHSKLQIFQKVAEKLSFTKAAGELYMTQPAVTKHIHKLEQDLQTKLFVRHGSKISLTEAGKILLNYARKIDKTYNELHFELGQLKSKFKGKLRIGASTTITQYVLPEKIKKFQKRYPDLQISVINGNTEFIEKSLRENRIDLGIIEGQSKHHGIQYQTFLKDEIVLVSRPEVLPASKHIDLEQLKKLPLVIRESGSGTREVIAHYCRQKGYKLSDFNIVLEYGSTQGIKNYLLQSDTFAFLSLHSILKELKQKELQIVDIKDFKIARFFNFIYPEGQQNSLVNLFINFIL